MKNKRGFRLERALMLLNAAEIIAKNRGYRKAEITMAIELLEEEIKRRKSKKRVRT